LNEIRLFTVPLEMAKHAKTVVENLLRSQPAVKRVKTRKRDLDADVLIVAPAIGDVESLRMLMLERALAGLVTYTIRSR
jgi:hypothetical protein